MLNLKILACLVSVSVGCFVLWPAAASAYSCPRGQYLRVSKGACETHRYQDRRRSHRRPARNGVRTPSREVEKKLVAPAFSASRPKTPFEERWP